MDSPTRRGSSTCFALIVLGASWLLGSPAASQVATDDSLQATASDEIDTLGLGELTSADLANLRARAEPTEPIDAWRNGSSAPESWVIATGANVGAQRQEMARLGIEAQAAIGRAETSGRAYAAAVNREQTARRRLQALVVDSFVNGERDALDKFAGNQAAVYVATPIDVATETISARRDRIATVRSTQSQIFRERVDISGDAAELVRAQSYRVEEAEELDRVSRRVSLEHPHAIRDRRDQVIAVSGEAPETVLVGGFRVSPEIAEPLADMLAAAAANTAVPTVSADDASAGDSAAVESSPAGIDETNSTDAEPAAEEVPAPIILGGWGYRSTEEQIVLRMGHCGESGFAIFDGPSPACNPPTARPLHSEHEKGLAIDFTENGVILNSSSPAFHWLQANAAAYGFYNLPSEPWHWSTTGS